MRRRVAQLQDAVRGDGSRICWLHGRSGCGKSHLLQASCAMAQQMGHVAGYLPLAELVEFGPGALEGWEEANLVALDDLPMVLGERVWEEALFSLYLSLEERGAMLLAAASGPVAQQTFTLPDLGSRFAAALPVSLQSLDEPDQRLALQRRARARGLELPDDAAHYLQRHFRRDLSTLCQLLDAIDTASLQAQRRLTVRFIREVLALQPPL